MTQPAERTTAEERAAMLRELAELRASYPGTYKGLLPTERLIAHVDALEAELAAERDVHHTLPMLKAARQVECPAARQARAALEEG